MDERNGIVGRIGSYGRNGAILSRFYTRKMGNEKASPGNRSPGIKKIVGCV